VKIRILQAQASNGARLLVGALREEGLNALRTKVQGSTYRGYPSHLIVNWGRNEYPSRWSGVPVLNKPENVRNATDKRRFFQIMGENGLSHNIPRWTDSRTEAREFFESYGLDTVYCRTLTRGSQGRGVVVATSEEEIVPAPLYTEGIKVDREVRVHVFKERVIDFAQKKKMSSESREERGISEEPDEYVRNHGNGWIFARSGVEIPDSVKVCALQSVSTLGLDFGAVDVVINQQGVPKLLEVNTAPGLEGTTLESYKGAILEYCGIHRSG
jgi:hypothetical protein